MFFGSRFKWKIFIASVKARTLARNFIIEFPRQSSGKVRHCGLSKSVLLGAHWRAVCFLSENAFVSRSDGNVTKLPRGQSSEMAPPWVKDRSACYRHAALYMGVCWAFSPPAHIAGRGEAEAVGGAQPRRAGGRISKTKEIK